MLRHKHMRICEAIRDAGGQPFVVGGFVRDLVMGRVAKDVDIVVVGLTEKACIDALLTVDPDMPCVGNHFPVYIVRGVEVALARLERKTGDGHTGFDCEVAGVTLEQDLERRDLTINAMAMDPFTNAIIDPFGGRRHIKERILRPVGHHFREDPLRVLRAARFAAQLGMEPCGQLLAECLECLEELHTLPGERVFGELVKALNTDKPSKFFLTLDQLGALDLLFPEIAALQGRVQPEKYHPEGDAFVHTMLVVDRARQLNADDETMYAALLHDLGKAITPDHELPHHYNHEKLGVPLTHQVSDRLSVPTSFRRAAAMASQEHLNIHRFDGLKPIKKVRLIVRLGALQNDRLLERVALAAQADAQGRGPDLIDQPYPQRQRVAEAAAVLRGVRGDQFAHLKDGRVIAENMERARGKALVAAGFTKS